MARTPILLRRGTCFRETNVQSAEVAERGLRADLNQLNWGGRHNDFFNPQWYTTSGRAHEIQMLPPTDPLQALPTEFVEDLPKTYGCFPNEAINAARAYRTGLENVFGAAHSVIARRGALGGLLDLNVVVHPPGRNDLFVVEIKPQLALYKNGKH